MEPSGSTNRWVAAPGDARRAAHALFSVVVRRLRLWTFLGVTALAVTAISAASGANLVGAALLGFGWVACIMGVLLGLGYVNVRRRFARQLAPGFVFESEFEVDRVVLRTPWTATTLQFPGIDRVQPRGEWVLMRYRRSRLTSVWPSALFPPADLARLQEDISARS